MCPRTRENQQHLAMHYEKHCQQAEEGVSSPVLSPASSYELSSTEKYMDILEQMQRRTMKMMMGASLLQREAQSPGTV